MYQIVDDCCVCRLEDKTYIPFDDSNADYRSYKEWLADGNVPAPAASDRNSS